MDGVGLKSGRKVLSGDAVLVGRGSQAMVMMMDDFLRVFEVFCMHLMGFEHKLLRFRYCQWPDRYRPMPVTVIMLKAGALRFPDRRSRGFHSP